MLVLTNKLYYCRCINASSKNGLLVSKLIALEVNNYTVSKFFPQHQNIYIPLAAVITTGLKRVRAVISSISFVKSHWAKTTIQ